MCSYEKNSLLPTLIASQRLTFFLVPLNLLEYQFLYVNNICSKFQGQKINTKKDIHNLPKCVILRNNCRNHFTTPNFDTLSRAEKLLIYYKKFASKFLYVNNMCAKFQGQKNHTK